MELLKELKERNELIEKIFQADILLTEMELSLAEAAN